MEDAHARGPAPQRREDERGRLASGSASVAADAARLAGREDLGDDLARVGQAAGHEGVGADATRQQGLEPCSAGSCT